MFYANYASALQVLATVQVANEEWPPALDNLRGAGSHLSQLIAERPGDFGLEERFKANQKLILQLEAC